MILSILVVLSSLQVFFWFGGKMLNNIFVGKLEMAMLVRIAIIVAITLFLMFVVVKLIVKILKKSADGFKMKSLSASMNSVEKSIRKLIFFTGLYFALTSLPFNLSILYYIGKIYKIIMIFVISAGLIDLCNTWSRIMSNEETELIKRKPAFAIIIPLGFKILVFLIVVVTVVMIATEFGFEQLQSLLTGVGIGGVAVALAAQDLLKNVLGGFVILTDRTFNAGDLIKIDSNEGIVEEVGIRSTKVRTLDKELIVVPNSKFADGAVTNYSQRGTRRVKQVIGATYSTSSEKLKSSINKIKTVLLEDSRIVKDSSSVRFDNFGDSALEILIIYLVNTPDYDEYMLTKQDINYKIMQIFEEEGVDFAFPSMSVYMEK